MHAPNASNDYTRKRSGARNSRNIFLFYSRRTLPSSTLTLYNHYIFAEAVLHWCVYVWRWYFTHSAQECHNSNQILLNAVANTH